MKACICCYDPVVLEGPLMEMLAAAAPGLILVPHDTPRLADKGDGGIFRARFWRKPDSDGLTTCGVGQTEPALQVRTTLLRRMASTSSSGSRNSGLIRPG